MAQASEMTASGAAVSTRNCRPGKYLTFCLGAEEFGLEILKVREIIGLMDITPIPKTPKYIRGVINLRGKVIPVLNLRLKFGMDAVKDTEQTCIIVAEVAAGDSCIMTGVVVDAVSEVLDVEENQMEEPPSFGSGVDIDFIMGIAKIKNQVKMLLDIDKIIDTVDLSAVNAAQE